MTGAVSKPRHLKQFKPAEPGQRLTTSAMIASIAAEGQATRPAPFGHALVELAKSRPEIVGMSADLSKYTDMHIFAQAYPDRFYQMGMAEQLLMGAAAGLAREGFLPFATTYAVFASRRAYDEFMQQPHRLSFAWGRSYLEEERKFFGKHPFYQGLKENHHDVQNMITFADQQGMLARSLTVEELFTENTRNT